MTERDDDELAGAVDAASKPKPERKTRSDKGKPRSHARGAGRFQRRAEKATETVRELTRIRMPELDVSELSFVETVDRDADAWGDFLAQLGEWFVPFGAFLDLFFGAGLIRVLRVAPSFRAGRRELMVRREQRAAERAEQAEEEELAAAIERDHESARTTGIFAAEPPPPAPEPEPEPEMTRDEWLASGGAGA